MSKFSILERKKKNGKINLNILSFNSWYVLPKFRTLKDLFTVILAMKKTGLSLAKTMLNS